MFAGTWGDWDLCREVALIDDATWVAGAEAVAARIQQIIAERSPLSKPAAQKQAHDLLKNPQQSSLCAEGLARYLKEVIEVTKRDFNGLPEPFKPLAPLTVNLFRLSTAVLASPTSEAETELAAILQSSAVNVATLLERLREAQAEVARLRTALAEAKDLAEKNASREAAFKSPKAGWIREFAIVTAGSAAGALAPIYCPELYGYLSVGLHHLLGAEMSDTIAAVAQCYSDFVRPETVPDLPWPSELELAQMLSGSGES